MEKQIKTAIATVAVSGFGREFSRLLAKDGFNLLLVDINRASLQKVKAEIESGYHAEIDLPEGISLKPESFYPTIEFTENKSI
jgi:short-subunit dehydrogenase